MIKLLAVAPLISVLIISACGGGAGQAGDGRCLLSGIVDSQVTTRAGASASPLADATIHVIDYTGMEASTVVVGADGKYSVKVAKNATYSVKAEKSGVAMKSLVTVGAADATADVNPASTAAVAVFQQKFSIPIGEGGTSFKEVFDNIDIARTADNIYNAPSFGTLAGTVKNAVAANFNPFTVSDVDAQARTAANEAETAYIVPLIGTWAGTGSNEGMTVVFAADTIVTTGTACPHTSSYTLIGNAVHFTITATTATDLVGCTSLVGTGNISTYIISGSTLTLTNTAGYTATLIRR